MKKHFMYVAAAAIALMTSCTNEEVLEDIVTPENPNEVVDDGTTRMAIELGIADTTFTVSTRGTGTVGDIEGQVTNVWNGQPLEVIMVEQGTYTEASITANGVTDNLLKNLNFNAPKGVSFGNIIMTKGSDTENIKYYPLTDAFDFFGYHLGGTTAPAETATFGENGITIPVVIDGTQDIMAAKAALQEGDLAKLENKAERAYSSWAARRDVHPVLSFQHLLSRFTFNVIAGEAKAAKASYIAEDESTTADNVNTFPLMPGVEAGTTQDGAVYIEKIEILNQANDVILTLAHNEQAPVSLAKAEGEEWAAENNPLVNFELKQKATITQTDEDGQTTTVINPDIHDLVPLTATAPAEYNASNRVLTPVGESIMTLPSDTALVAKITVKQYCQVLDGTVENPTVDNVYTWKSQTMDAKINFPEGKSKFEAGNSYAVNITVFGYQRIEVSAQLQGWHDGGASEVNPEDQAWGDQ